MARTLKRALPLRITAADDCPRCAGTGFNIEHEHSELYHTLKVNIVVCACVRLIPTRKQSKGDT